MTLGDRLHSRPCRRHRGALAAAFGLGIAGAATSASARADILPKWGQSHGHAELSIALGEALAPKQRTIIGGGFTTLTQLTITTLSTSRQGDGADRDGAVPPPQIAALSCSVTYDAWEETYSVTTLDDEQPTTRTLKTYADLADLCLTARIAAPDRLVQLRGGGVVRGTLTVRQTSPEEATRIKQWLVRQQSSLLQGLFSHMLGELSLSQALELTIDVPAMAAGSGPDPETARRDRRRQTPGVPPR